MLLLKVFEYQNLQTKQCNYLYTHDSELIGLALEKLLELNNDSVLYWDQESRKVVFSSGNQVTTCIINPNKDTVLATCKSCDKPFEGKYQRVVKRQADKDYEMLTVICPHCKETYCDIPSLENFYKEILTQPEPKEVSNSATKKKQPTVIYTLFISYRSGEHFCDAYKTPEGILKAIEEHKELNETELLPSYRIPDLHSWKDIDGYVDYFLKFKDGSWTIISKTELRD